MEKIIFSIGDTQIKAADPTGPVIATINGNDYNAYKELKDIKLEGGRRRFFLNTRFILESITGSPLNLDLNESQFQGNTNIQVYTGQLDFTWRETKFFFRMTKGSTAVNVTVRLQYRKDDQNIELYCFDPDDPADANALICVYMHGEMATQIQGIYKKIFLMAKSNMPFQSGVQMDPAPFDVRKASLICYLE